MSAVHSSLARFGVSAAAGVASAAASSSGPSSASTAAVAASPAAVAQLVARLVSAVAASPASVGAAASAASSGVAAAAGAAPSFPSRVLGFLFRLLGALVRFLGARMVHWPLIGPFVAQARHRVLGAFGGPGVALEAADGAGAHAADRLIRATSLLQRVAQDVARYANWTLNPARFVRRLYRFSVGLIVLYCVHAIWSLLSERVRAAKEWLKLERGIWNGEVACIRKRELDEAMARASSYAEWRTAAAQMDELEVERMEWKHATPSADYQFKRIARNVDSIRNLIAAHKAQRTTRGDEATAGLTSPAALSASATHAAASSSANAATAVPSLSSSAPIGGVAVPAPAPAHSDPQALMRFLRSRLFRHIGNCTNSQLYFDSAADTFSSSLGVGPRSASTPGLSVAALPCRVGTKRLIESYHTEVQRGLETVLRDETIPAHTKLAFFRETRHAYGRSALLLNGGANLGLLHLGVVAALLEIDMLPQIISGSSVGAIFAALVCSRTDAQLARIGSPNFLELEFPSVNGSLRRKLRRFLEEGILMDMQALIGCVRSHIGDLTFLQAHERYGRILNIVVTPIHTAGKKRRRTSSGDEADPADHASVVIEDEEEVEKPHSSEPILLNYLTAPSVLIWSAACASCAVPHLYKPVELLAKNPAGEIIPYFGGDDDDEHMRFGGGCVDGSVVKMDVTVDRLRTLFNTNNFIVSQLNLSLLPFIFGGTSFSAASPLQKLVRYLAREIYQRVLNLGCLMGITAGSLGRSNLVRVCLYIHSLTSQAIKGDITLIPPVSWKDYSQLLENPSTQRLNDCVDVARRYTWTKASLIQAHCVVEFALDRCVRTVRTEMGLAHAPPTCASAAFAHPNRSYTSTGNGSPAFVLNQQNQHSPSSTPAPPTTVFWSKKLNARALQPSRKASFTERSSPPPGQVPVLDLAGVGVGRQSPPTFQGGPLGFQSPSGSIAPLAPRHRSNSNANQTPVQPLVPMQALPSGPLSPPQMRATTAHPTSGIEFVSGSPMRRPLATVPLGPGLSPAIKLPAMMISGQGRISPSSSTSLVSGSPSGSPLSGDPDADDDSLSISPPGSPMPADSSRDDLRSQAGASQLTLSSPSPSTPATHSRTPSNHPSRLRLGARTPADNNGSGLLRDRGVRLVSPSPSSFGVPVSSATGVEGSLLRSVPSIPGSGPGFSLSLFPRTTSGSGSGSALGTTLPSSVSGSTLNPAAQTDDCFNRGVMAHLNQQMMFMPSAAPRRKKKAAAVPSPIGGTTIATGAIHNGDGAAIWPSTSGSDTNSADEAQATATAALQQHALANGLEQAANTKLAAC